jgi:multidrug efflux pump subunit AcrB
MTGLTKIALENRMVFLLLALIIALGGPYSFSSHPSREDPEITIRAAVVTANFAGMTPERIEELITRKIEEKARELPEVESITSVSRSGTATVTVELQDQYFDVAPIWQRLRNKMTDLQNDLPDGTSLIQVNDDYGNVAMATIALTAEGFSRAEMREAARQLRNRFYSVEGVRKVELFGVEEETIFVEFNNSMFAQLGITASEIVSTLQSQNIVLPGGRIQAGGIYLTVEPSGNFETIEDIGAVPIELPNQEAQVVYLRDIAEITRAYSDPPKSPAYFNGEPAIVISISMIDMFDALAFGEELGQRVRELETTLPIGYRLQLITFQPEDIRVALDGVLNNLYQTIAIVLAVVIVFLGVRLGLIVGVMVPLTMLLSILVMRFVGIELERMSLASLIIALGLLVDNGIVIAEEISRRISVGIERFEACVGTGKDMALPLLSSSLTTIFAFMPLMLADNVAGEYTRSLSLVIAIALLGSWCLAMTVTPLFCYWFVKVPKSTANKASGENVLYRAYRRLLTTLLNFRIATLACVVASLVGAFWLFQFVPKIFFPASERAQVQVYLDLPVGTNVYTTLESIEHINDWLGEEQSNLEITNFVSYVASGGPRFFLSLNPIDPDPHRAFILVNIEDASSISVVMERIRNYALENLPEARIEVKPLSMGAGEAGLLQYRLYGDDADTVFGLAQSLENSIRLIPGARNIRNDWGNRTIRIVVNVDQAQARRAGLTSEDVAQALNAILSGVGVTDYRDGDTSIPVTLRAEAADRDNIDRLRTLTITSRKGIPVPLLQIATFEGVPQFSIVHRRDLERLVTVSAVHATLTAAQLNAELAPAIAALDLPEGYRVEPAGEIADSADAQSALFANMPLAGVLIIVVLVWQFNSYRKPAIILSVIPLTIVGVVLGLLLMPGAVFGFMAMMGMLSLAGIIINNAIVLIDRIDIELAEGRSVDEAIVEASMKRLRPILMTTLTTILGLAPIIVSGDVLFYDLSVVIAGGLAVGTILTLGVVPILYSLVFSRSAAAEA